MKRQKYRVEDPVSVKQSQIKNCLLLLGVEEGHAELRSRQIYAELKTFVSSAYQEELNHYLVTQTVTNSDIGKRIERLMMLNFDSFFEAITTLGISEVF